MDVQKTKNTLNIDYEYDKLNNVGQFALTYRKDNQTVKVNENDNVSIYYFKEGKGDLHLVSNPKIIGGQVKFDQVSMGSSLSSGTYDIYSSVNGEIYPSQGYVKIKLETHVEAGVQVTVLTGPKGDTGDSGQAGKDAPTITNVNYTNNNLVFTLSDKSTISTPLTLPAGPKGDVGLTGQAGKDAPKIDNVSLSSGVLTFTLSDGSKYTVNLPLLKGDRGETGQAGKDAPKITNVNYVNSYLIFTLSDKSTISTPLTLPVGPKGDTGQKGSDGLSAYQLAVQQGFKGSEQEWIASLKGQKGDAGDSGQNGKDAPKITNVSYANNNLVFTLSDESSISTPLVLPSGPKGDAGKDAPKIDNVSLDGSTLAFTLSDGSKYTVNLPLLKGDPGQVGKDAPKITNVNYQDSRLTFTLSDGTNVSTPLTLPAGQKGDTGEKGSDGLSAYEIAKKDGFSGTEAEWLESLKGPQGPAGKDGKDGAGSKLKRVFYDGAVRQKAIFENDDGTSIESNIFSDPMLPANPHNLTHVSLLKSDQPHDITPQVLKAGLKDATIKVPFKLYERSPTSSGYAYNSLDIHLDTSDFLNSAKTVHFKPLNTLEEFVKHQWIAKEVSISQDSKTVAVKILPVVDTNQVCIPLFDEKWFNSIGDFKSLNSYNVIPNLAGADSDFPADFHGFSFTIFSNFEKISFETLGNVDSLEFLMLLYGANKPLVRSKGGAVANLQYGTVLPLDLIFTGTNN